ncbi:hypothetical protein MSKOL_0425 [Methanosarcina sp. Kolksee]|nr:hypothetical protein MSKOL_0425 [Methanosarcina sp. Kolksee]
MSLFRVSLGFRVSGVLSELVESSGLLNIFTFYGTYFKSFDFYVYRIYSIICFLIFEFISSKFQLVLF